MLSNISRSKENQAMKFAQLIEYNKRNIFHQKSSRKCFFKKVLYEVNASGLQLSFNIFR